MARGTYGVIVTCDMSRRNYENTPVFCRYCYDAPNIQLPYLIQTEMSAIIPSIANLSSFSLVIQLEDGVINVFDYNKIVAKHKLEW